MDIDLLRYIYYSVVFTWIINRYLSDNCNYNLVDSVFFGEVVVALMVQKFHCLLFVEQKVHYSIHKSLSMVPLFSQINLLGIVHYFDFVKRPVLN
jgi:hypothetical protein